MTRPLIVEPGALLAIAMAYCGLLASAFVLGVYLSSHGAAGGL